MAKRKIEEKGTITCVINKELSIILKNVMDAYGHDDSLPFKADVYIKSKKMGFTEPTLIANAWNDGWGGDTVIESKSYLKIVNAIDEYLGSHYQIHVKKPDFSWAVRLDYLVSVMAEMNIYRKLTHVDIMDIDDCECLVGNGSELKAPAPEEKKVDEECKASICIIQTYRFAQCLVQLPLDTKEVTIALASRDCLHIEKGSQEDKKIFYYCKSYNEFLELLVKAPVFTSPEDFTIKSVIKLSK